VSLEFVASAWIIVDPVVVATRMQTMVVATMVEEIAVTVGETEATDRLYTKSLTIFRILFHLNTTIDAESHYISF
jgi:hypothetical protein